MQCTLFDDLLIFNFVSFSLHLTIFFIRKVLVVPNLLRFSYNCPLIQYRVLQCITSPSNFLCFHLMFVVQSFSSSVKWNQCMRQLSTFISIVKSIDRRKVNGLRMFHYVCMKSAHRIKSFLVTCTMLIKKNQHR